MKSNKLRSAKKMLVFMLGKVFALSSCNKDHDVENLSDFNPVVGTKWVANDGEYVYFKTRSTGIYYEGDSYDKGDSYEDFSYKFNSKDNTILMLFGDEYESAQYTTGYLIWDNTKFYKD